MTPIDESEILPGLGKRVKLLRARRGMTRRVLAGEADVSERHLANLESGTGNVSILVLAQVAQALDCSLAELLGDETTSSPEWLSIRRLLHGREPSEIARALQGLSDMFGNSRPHGGATRHHRIALVGLRGAGKSTLGQMVAAKLGYPFVELRLEITRLAGCAPAEIQALYGSNAYRRYERQALEDTLQTYPSCVIATAGGLVSDNATFDLLLNNCLTVWLQATPEDHFTRVLAQGDLRQLPGNRNGVEDIRLTLESRVGFYAKSDLAFNTSGKTLDEAFDGLMGMLRQHAWAAEAV
ncbi:MULTISPECIES: helix-turn-helix transcriptional regulator [Acidocella]|uniref:helix-turn-helix transcriptional regulator n=1 Tax=Acidocella TaxID=50709 RepID=UPI00028ECEFC|nr:MULTISPECIES: helix-turn-helix transcriptional regulator [Acidocella]EKM99985.1 anaerobic benzoate catabolism transcriptional regulator [Acidocella sp. MX-AZ02]WBO59574.1 helix-turn-helix transcriptional regulator [Acidocella sp. MX-AZ03]